MSKELLIHDEARTIEPTVHRLKARVQGEIVFIGDYWLTMAETRSLRDWLTASLPADTGDKP